MTIGVAARGSITRSHLEELGLRPGLITDCADAAFALRVGQQAKEKARTILDGFSSSQSLICVSPSSVVEEYCNQRSIDYVEIVRGFIRRLTADHGHSVMLLPHSSRPGRESRKNNDLPVCRRVHRGLPSDTPCLFVEEPLNAEELRALIGSCRLLVASRFHAMISGLAMNVPTLLIGWSHKYAEVLEVFSLEDYALDYSDLTLDALLERFQRLDSEEAEVRRRIEAALPAVMDASVRNAVIAVDFLRRGKDGASL